MEAKLILICRVNVGNLPIKKANDYIERFKDNFLKDLSLPEYVKSVFIGDKSDTSFEVINLGDSLINIAELENIVGDEKDHLINLRLSSIEKSIILQQSKKHGFKNLSEYLRFVGLNSEIKVDGKER